MLGRFGLIGKPLSLFTCNCGFFTEFSGLIDERCFAFTRRIEGLRATFQKHLVGGNLAIGRILALDDMADIALDVTDGFFGLKARLTGNVRFLSRRTRGLF